MSPITTPREYIDNFVKTNGDPSKIEFQRTILKTSFDLVGVTLPMLRKLTSELLNLFSASKIIEILNLNSLDEQILFTFISSHFYIEEYKNKMHHLLSIADSWVITDVSEYNAFKKSSSLCVSFCDEFLKAPFMLEKRIAFIFMLRYLVKINPDYVVSKIIEFGNAQEYLLQMAIAWTIQVLFLENKSSVFTILSLPTVSLEIKTKAIQKLIDSRRVSEEDKAQLKQIRSNLRNKTI